MPDEKVTPNAEDTAAEAPDRYAGIEAVDYGDETPPEETPAAKEGTEAKDAEGKTPDADGKKGGGEEATEAKEGDAPPEGAEDDDKPVPVSALKKRIAREQRKTARAEEEAARLRKELEERDAKAVVPEEPPKLEDFPDYDTFIEAKAAFKARETIREEREKEKQAEAARQRAETINKNRQAFEEKAEAYSETVEDFDEVAAGIVPIMQSAPHLTQLVVESDFGPQIAYYLGQNPEIAQKLASLEPHLTAKEIGKIAARLENAPKPKLKSEAPEPISTVSGQDPDAVQKSGDEMPMEEYAAYRKAGKPIP